MGSFCGHHHQACLGIFAGKPCWISPSVATTHIIAGNRSAGINLTHPAYSLISYQDGKLVTSVVEVCGQKTN